MKIAFNVIVFRWSQDGVVRTSNTWQCVIHWVTPFICWSFFPSENAFYFLSALCKTFVKDYVDDNWYHRTNLLFDILQSKRRHVIFLSHEWGELCFKGGDALVEVQSLQTVMFLPLGHLLLQLLCLLHYLLQFSLGSIILQLFLTQRLKG